MAVNEVIYDGETLISLTNDTVTENDLPEGVTAHDASGEQITGTKNYVRSVNNIAPDVKGNVALEQVDWEEQSEESSVFIKNKPNVASQEDLTKAKEEVFDNVLTEAKAYTDEEIAKFDFVKVVDSLPDEGLPNKVYLVPKNNTQTQDLFDEYVWVNKGTVEAPEYVWEWITTKQLEVDLTNYTTTNNVEAMILERSKKEHPVGSLYLSMIETNPTTILGFGTWQLIGANRMIMGATNSSQAGTLGGNEFHTHDVAFRFASWYNEVVLENHEETGIMAYEPNGSKTATGNTRVAYTSADSENNYYNTGTETGKTASGQMGLYETVGNTSYEPNTPPYIKINVWQRTA